LAAELKESLGQDSELIEGSGGVFEIEYKGKLIFSKKKLGRFPDEHEILQIVKQLRP
jgi:selenoprotein W-related protein